MGALKLQEHGELNVISVQSLNSLLAAFIIFFIQLVFEIQWGDMIMSNNEVLNPSTERVCPVKIDHNVNIDNPRRVMSWDWGLSNYKSMGSST